MGGIAQILKDSGHDVSGSDMQFYPPMSDQLKSSHIDLVQGYKVNDLPKADLYIIGNALSRGNDSVEHILENNLPFKSGPDILGEMLTKKKCHFNFWNPWQNNNFLYAMPYFFKTG